MPDLRLHIYPQHRIMPDTWTAMFDEPIDLGTLTDDTWVVRTEPCWLIRARDCDEGPYATLDEAEAAAHLFNRYPNKVPTWDQSPDAPWPNNGTIPIEECGPLPEGSYYVTPQVPGGHRG